MYPIFKNESPSKSQVQQTRPTSWNFINQFK
uniref:Uncharacterized protein n=1 Tax=Rhizophora mucronata TaxID=61149 RepID=A0A2P2J3Y6_RHIMU